MSPYGTPVCSLRHRRRRQRWRRQLHHHLLMMMNHETMQAPRITSTSARLYEKQKQLLSSPRRSRSRSVLAQEVSVALVAVAAVRVLRCGGVQVAELEEQREAMMSTTPVASPTSSQASPVRSGRRMEEEVCSGMLGLC